MSTQTINTNLFYASQLFVSILSLRPYHKGCKEDIKHWNNAELTASTQTINTNVLCQSTFCVDFEFASLQKGPQSECRTQKLCPTVCVNQNAKHTLFMWLNCLCRFWVCVPTIKDTKWISNTKTMPNSLRPPKRSIQTFHVSKIFASILRLRPYHKGHKVDIEHHNNAEQFASTQTSNTNFSCQ